MKAPLEPFEARLGYGFRDKELLTRALTHRSWMAERGPARAQNEDNEQLEFLGDAILGFIASESLLARHPLAREGQLSQWKAHLVSALHLHSCALELGLGEHLLLGKGEDRNGGRNRRTLLANALEAVIAAMYLDGGIQATRIFIEKHILSALDSPEDVEWIGRLNHKSVLQERTQALGFAIPRYITVETSGPEHAKVFTVEARIGKELASRATGNSKKAASQHAAQLLLEQLDLLAASEMRHDPEERTQAAH